MPSPGQVAQPRPQHSDMSTLPAPLQAGQAAVSGGVAAGGVSVILQSLHRKGEDMDHATLAAYQRRIGLGGALRADEATLRALVLHHAEAIAFENVAAFCGQSVSLEVADVVAKLVHGRRGGWCFEQNLLFGTVLRTLGFEVVDLAARVLWGHEETARTARTHQLLKVGAEGREFIVDVGFGGMTPTGILVPEVMRVQQTPHEPFRLRPLEQDLLLEAQVPDAAGGAARWLPLYRFNLQPQWPLDYLATNYQLSTDPASRFVQNLALARPVPQGRYSLRNRQLVFRSRDGGVEQREIGSAAQLVATLEDVFGLDTATMPGLVAHFDALPRTGEHRAKQV